MNIECRISKEGILSIFIKKKDRAQRFHPSKFDIRYSIFCGSLSNPAAKAASLIIKTVPFWRSFTRCQIGNRGNEELLRNRV